MNQAARRVGQFALATAVAVAAFHLGAFLAVLFLLPLQWVRSRLGEAAFVASALLALAGIWGVTLLISLIGHTPWNAFDTIPMTICSVLVAGWVAIVLLERTGWRFVYRTLLVTVVVAAVLYPLAGHLIQEETFSAYLKKSFDTIWGQTFAGSSLENADQSGPSKADYLEMLKQSFLSAILVSLFLIWTLTGFVAKLIRKESSGMLRNFRMPPQGAWVFLGLWIGIAVLALTQAYAPGKPVDLGVWVYVLASFAVIGLILYLLVGLGVAESLMARWQWPRIIRFAVRGALLLLPFVTIGGLVVVFVGLPLLGVLELWMNLRTRTQEVGQ